MNCPFCGDELEPGYIYGRKDCGLLWLPAGKKAPLLVSEEAVMHQNGMILGERPGFENTKLEYHLCRKCRKAVSVF